MSMKMAKASAADLNMALKICSILEDIGRGFVPDGVLIGPEEAMALDDSDGDVCCRIVRHLQDVLRHGSIGRVIWGMVVVSDPANKCIDPDADTIERHPIVQQMEDALLWIIYHYQGGSSDVRQPIRKLLGIGQLDRLTEEQIAAAKRFGGSVS